MANETYVKIATVNVGAGGSASIIFSSIPQTYTDLELVISARTSNASAGETDCLVTINSDTTTANYTWKRLRAFNNTVQAGTGTGMTIGFVNASAYSLVSFANAKIYYPNYTASTSKTYSVENINEVSGSGTNYLQMFAGLYSPTTAITNLNVNVNATTFVQNSTVSLYGILKGSGGATVS